MGLPAKKPATYEDVLSVPENLVAQVVNGTLYTHPRPTNRHAMSASMLGADLVGPFGKGRGGPGGWLILDEPELHLGGDILVPDLAGWRRERLPELPDAPFIEIAPNWVCEVLSPSTEALDRTEKLAIFAVQGVTHVWFINPATRTLEVLQLDGTTYRVKATHAGDAVVRAEPFDAIELALSDLWSR